MMLSILIAEATVCDFIEALEVKKKSASVFCKHILWHSFLMMRN